MILNELYPESVPFAEHKLAVSGNHIIHIEEHGNPDGDPIIYVHGGPGGGVDAGCARYFNPKKWRIILFDQRGCGKSLPFASLENNTTWDLIDDIELIRNKLGINSWVVFGGSWGSTLSLAYAQSFPKRCRALILRGIFLARPQDADWLYSPGGAGRIFPDGWDKFLAPIPMSDRSNLVEAYYKRLTSDDSDIRTEAALAWSIWEGSICQLISKKETLDQFSGGHFAQAFSRIECHYFTNKCFFSTDNYLLENMHKLRDVRGYIVHGRYDVICPIDQAWELHKSWPGSQLSIVADGGHSVTEPGIRSKLIEIADSFS